MNHRPPTDAVFAGSIPEIYDEYLVPLIFESYANDLVARLQHLAAGRVLELACGTGVVTRVMASRLPDSIEIVSSDLNRAMIDRASSVGTSRSVTWRQADALELPFADGSFDAVACQFGVMFFPDKVQAYSQALRVLRPGGVFRVQHMGPHREQRVRPCGHIGGWDNVSRRSTGLPRPDTTWVSRRGDRTCRLVGGRVRVDRLGATRNA